MKTKKILLIFIATIATLLLLSVKSEATLELNNLDFDVQINEDGSMDVTETWNIYISETNTLFKTFERDSSKYSEITDVTVTEITNGVNKDFWQINTEMYHVTKDCYYALNNSKGMFEIAWGVGLDNSSDTRKYQISYTVKDAITKYNDYAELYWKFVGNDFEINAKRVHGKITLPYNAQSKDDIRVWGHTKYLNGEIYVTDLNEIEFTINQYSRGNYVEIRSLIPSDMIGTTNRQYDYNIYDSVLKEETQWADEANRERKNIDVMTNIFFVVIAIITIVLFILTIKKIVKLIKLKRNARPTNKIKHYRELPYEDATPAEALFVFSKGEQKTFSDSFSANILDLCLKKYIIIEVEKGKQRPENDDVKIRILDKDISELKKDQQTIMNFLKKVSKGENILTIQDITFYLTKNPSSIQNLNIEIEKEIIEQEVQMENYDPKMEKEYKKHWIYVIVYFFLMILAGIVIPVSMLAFVNFILEIMLASKKYIFTKKGINEREQWKAFKKYMEDFSLLKDKEVPSLAVWEKYLVFATAFGISEKVLKQLKVIYPEITYMDSSTYSNYSYIHIMNSVNIGNGINSSVHSAVSSSGSGYGGGFSGGGGGGRWPEVAVADAKIFKNIHNKLVERNTDVFLSSYKYIHIIR